MHVSDSYIVASGEHFALVYATNMGRVIKGRAVEICDDDVQICGSGANGFISIKVARQGRWEEILAIRKKRLIVATAFAHYQGRFGECLASLPYDVLRCVPHGLLDKRVEQMALVLSESALKIEGRIKAAFAARARARRLEQAHA